MIKKSSLKSLLFEGREVVLLNCVVIDNIQSEYKVFFKKFNESNNEEMYEQLKLKQ